MEKTGIALLLSAAMVPALAQEHPIKQRALAQCINAGTAKGAELETTVKYCVCGFEIYSQHVTLKQHIELDTTPDAASFTQALGTRRDEVRACVDKLD